ncbi:MAG TPA: TetR/AcrR family transcriptional regulator [Bacteroidia bacterium]|nr:TetR/AcrR family transcriptional regulator [Bacteroidia bacterium]
MVKPKKEEASTEQQILEAARKIFREKGFDGARMQEIADEAKINKAMLHYYFRSKDQLFRRIFVETMQSFLGTIVLLLNQPSSTWEEKIYAIAERYTDFLKSNPGMPLFVMSELARSGHSVIEDLPVSAVVESSVFIRQLREEQRKKRVREIEPLQVIITIISGLVFPFVARPIIKTIGQFDDKKFNRFLEDRKIIVAEMLITYLRKK